MNRIYHTRIIWYQYAYLILIGLLAFWLLWTKAIIPAALCMLLLVFLIERFIHTTYTITPKGTLDIYTGRFFKLKTIRIEDIRSVEIRQSQLGKLTGVNFVLIQYGHNKYVSVLPIKKREFVALLEKRINELQNPLNT